MQGRLGEAGVVAGQFFDVAQGGSQGSLGRIAALIQALKCAHRGGVELFGVGQDALLGFESLVLAGNKMSCIDLLALVAPQIDHAQPILLALQKVVELGGGGAPAGVGFKHGSGIDAAEAVEQRALLGLVEGAEASRSARGPGPAPGRAGGGRRQWPADC